MSITIKKIAVLGSGVMGSGIAAQIANAGCDVVLFDIVPKDAAPSERTAIAKGAIERMLKTSPAPLMMPKNARRITPANLEDDLALLGECDWIIEVVLENLAVKHTTYKTINAHRKAGSIVSSNTSTIPLEHLTAPFGDDFKRDFLITHFFNPPRYLRLLELVTGTKTRPDAVAAIRDFSRLCALAKESCRATTAPDSSPTASARFGCRPASMSPLTRKSPSTSRIRLWESRSAFPKPPFSA